MRSMNRPAPTNSAPDGVVSLLEASLFLDPPAAILDAALDAVRSTGFDFDRAARILEVHGVIGIAKRHLDRSGIAVPRAFCEVADRACLRGEATAIMLDHFLAAAEKKFLRVMLLKGASLAQDIWDGFVLRGMSDLDLLVHPDDIGTALEVARAAGAAEPVEQLPLFWAERAHFHLKMVPRHPWLSEIEIHWSVRPEQYAHSKVATTIWLRASEIRVNGRRAFDLDPIDRLLHLITHIESHGIVLPRIGWNEFLRALAAAERPSIRLKWFADLFRVMRAMAPHVDPQAVTARAFEWQAESSVLAIAEILRTAPEHLGPAALWFEEITLAIARSASLPENDESRADWATTDEVMPAFGFRWSALRRLPAILWPETAYFRRKDGTLPAWARALWLARILHFPSAVIHLGVMGVITVIGLVLNRFARRNRRRLLNAPLSPELTLDLAALERRRTTMRAQSPA